MSDLALAIRQVRYENRTFWRNPAAAFFTFFFPLLFMVIFNVLFSAGQTASGFRISDFYTPSIIVFGVISATFTNIAMMVTIARDDGILKRVRGTPLPPWTYLFGRIGQAIGVALLLVIIVAAFGAIFYGVAIPWDRLPALVVTLVLGAGAFCALGLAVAGLIPNADAASPIVNFTILPLEFISNVFIDMRGAPDWLNTLSGIFPVRHFADAMLAVYNPQAASAGFSVGDLVVLALWGVAGVVIALRFFTWEPRR
jgi:ABC-2 type transport system permease protein